MRITTLFRKPVEETETVVGCRGTLVLHADGTAECEHDHDCGADDLLHDLWVACGELGCGCTGDELPFAA
jgi:hypothetical protein